MKLHAWEYTRTSRGGQPPGTGWEELDRITDAKGIEHTFWRRLVQR
jgi:hypothetical protein